MAASVYALPLELACRAGLDAGWIFLGSILVFGMVHGACDLWLPGWVLGRRQSAGFLAVFGGGYLALALAVWLLWQWLPAAATVGFLLLTAWHWGSADAVLTPLRSWRGAVLAWGRGFLVMTAPAAFHPAGVWPVLHALSPDLLDHLPPERLQMVAGMLLGWSLAAQVGAFAGSRCQPRDWLGHGLETCFLLALFFATEPLVGTALYFVWFHAWRHIGRLCLWQSPESRGVFVSLWSFHLAAVPCGLGALALLWAVARAWPGDLLRAYLVLLSAVTLPHALLVLWLDRRETSNEPSALVAAANVHR